MWRLMEPENVALRSHSISHPARIGLAGSLILGGGGETVLPEWHTCLRLCGSVQSVFDGRHCTAVAVAADADDNDDCSCLLAHAAVKLSR